MRADVVQMPAPVAEPVPQPRVRLAYTRKDGWIVVRQFNEDAAYRIPGDAWVARPGGKRVYEYEVLAWADLPPVPETAA